MAKEVLSTVSHDLWEKLYREVFKNDLQKMVLTNYSREMIEGMDVKLGLVKNKKGQIKVIGMAIKDYKDWDGNYELDEDGGKAKEATGLFSVNIDDFPKEMKTNILNEMNSIIIEPENYGNKGEPNLILSIMQKTIYDYPDTKIIKGSNFGDFLKDNYEKMGKEVVNDEGYGFDYNELGEDAQVVYGKFVASKLPEMTKGEIKEEDVTIRKKEYQEKNENGETITKWLVTVYVKNPKTNKEEIIKPELLQQLHDKYLRYYETVVNKESIVFYEFNQIIDEIKTNHTYSIKELIEDTKDIVNIHDIIEDIKEKHVYESKPFKNPIKRRPV